PLGERNFVGRSDELRTLREAVRSVGGERSEFILLAGEAGIGKTRLLAEVTRDAPPGVEIHWGFCSPVEGAPPFLIWQQCFRSLIRQRTLKAVLRAFGDSASEARRLLLDADRGLQQDNPAWDSPSKRFRTFDAISHGLAELARQRPLVLVLDDLQFADFGSLMLLEFLIQQRTTGLLLLGATRDAERSLEPARAAVLAAIRASCRSELVLSGLSSQEVQQFVAQRLGAEPRGLAESLHARTGGNPFFLTVLTLSQAALSPGAQPLPTAIRQAVSHRLSTLDADCVALLRTASVCGRELDRRVLAQVTKLPLEHCARLLDQGAAARVIAVTAGGDYRFVHDLIREVLYAELSAAERAQTHLAVGRALETAAEYQHARHAAMLAHHFAQGAVLGGATRALDLSIRAGAYALRNFAYEEAIQHFTRASQLLSQGSEVDPATECAVLLDLGLAQISAGQREAGQSTLTLAATKAREHGTTEDLASVALSLSPGLFAIEVGGYDPVLVGLLREALEQVGDSNPKLRALLLARLALALYWADTFDERVSICAEAERLSGALDAEEVRAAVMTAQALALSRPANLPERAQLTQRALELCGRVGDHHGLVLNRLHRASLLLEAGDLAAADFEADAFRKLAEEVQQPQALWIARALQSCRLLLDGRLAAVEAIAADCLQTGQRVRDHNALQTFGVHLTLVRIEQGRGREVLEALRNYAVTYPRTVAWRAFYAFALSRSGEPEKCAAEYASTKANGFAQPDDLLWPLSMAGLAEVCHTQGDAEGARVLYERFAPFANRSVVIGFGVGCWGSV
ncbi:MAG TPA: AAA family ATPase, partial [Polyangiaceae bacterium]